MEGRRWWFEDEGEEVDGGWDDESDVSDEGGLYAGLGACEATDEVDEDEDDLFGLYDDADRY
jgi:hypothetical protein